MTRVDMQKIIQLIETTAQRAYKLGQDDSKKGAVETNFKVDKATRLHLLNFFENNVTVRTPKR
jgi:hypothetical protein